MKFKTATFAVLVLTAPVDAAADPKTACFECHGEDGVATSSGYPSLAGQHAGYLLKQLRDFRGGQRSSPFMNIVAAKLKEEDLEAVAGWFAALQAPRADPAPAADAGRALYVRAGANGSCASCHGTAGEGAAQIPALRGQQMFYLREQLLNWRAGQRSNSPGRIMNQATDALSDSEIDALARYLSGM